jgi:hypothetical protein
LGIPEIPGMPREEVCYRDSLLRQVARKKMLFFPDPEGPQFVWTLGGIPDKTNTITFGWGSSLGLAEDLAGLTGWVQVTEDQWGRLEPVDIREGEILLQEGSEVAFTNIAEMTMQQTVELTLRWGYDAQQLWAMVPEGHILRLPGDVLNTEVLAGEPFEGVVVIHAECSSSGPARLEVCCSFFSWNMLIPLAVVYKIYGNTEVAIIATVQNATIILMNVFPLTNLFTFFFAFLICFFIMYLGPCSLILTCAAC